MTGQYLTDTDNVVRYVNRRSQRTDGSVDGSAFLLRENEQGLSVNWLDYFASLTKLQQLDEVRPLVRLTLRRSGRFAELNVGQTLNRISGRLSSARFVHRPLPADGKYKADPSHSQIEGLPPGDTDEAELIGDMIAECVTEIHSAVV